ncbi:FapA family protein [Caldisalinibacter kiritimatiensis]|uniref:Flagellar Assembly Protein A N-terminal region domain-containing protein n=1 Tax=Caldisalinibacter kiritimatiensis TaxID=1304284 RepID=R1CW09_9FIRM|nr:FapA family protein [Caldisalinibacter kiritimatiensis]EOD00829.1 protein of unknown function DUF342 [Caldisalinibacter kiritimatiensis]
MELFRNDYFTLKTLNNKVFIDIIRIGYRMQDFNSILDKHPRISITKFLNLRQALEKGTIEPVEIGVLKPIVEVKISSDNMRATVKLNITKEKFESNKKDIVYKVLTTLKEKGVTQGLKFNVLNNELRPLKEVVVAEGTLPTDGEDAVVKYIDIPEPQPTIREDGTADYYEINLIQQVKKGDWLGEKILLTTGIPGTNVKGEVLPPKKGKDKLLRYDKNSVKCIKQGNKQVLIADKDGVVEFKHGKICVLDHLIIPGDVGYETGNIAFNGYVTVKGIVHDGFSVIAEKDISILGTMGIGAVDKIVSKDGDVYIKGGVSGKNKTLVEAGKNIYVKYANSCTISCKDNVNIGFYAIDSKITAKHIIVNSKKGKIIGGQLSAKAKLVTPTVGNIAEKKTVLNVTGFNREAISKELNEILLEYKELLVQLEKNNRTLSIYENSLLNPDDVKEMDEYKYYLDSNEKLLNKISELEERRKILMEYLKSKGEGEVSILKKAYPKTFIQIKNVQKIIKNITNGTFFIENNTIHFD